MYQSNESLRTLYNFTHLHDPNLLVDRVNMRPLSSPSLPHRLPPSICHSHLHLHDSSHQLYSRAPCAFTLCNVPTATHDGLVISDGKREEERTEEVEERQKEREKMEREMEWVFETVLTKNWKTVSVTIIMTKNEMETSLLLQEDNNKIINLLGSCYTYIEEQTLRTSKIRKLRIPTQKSSNVPSIGTFLMSTIYAIIQLLYHVFFACLRQKIVDS